MVHLLELIWRATGPEADEEEKEGLADNVLYLIITENEKWREVELQIGDKLSKDQMVERSLKQGEFQPCEAVEERDIVVVDACDKFGTISCLLWTEHVLPSFRAKKDLFSSSKPYIIAGTTKGYLLFIDPSKVCITKQHNMHIQDTYNTGGITYITLHHITLQRHNHTPNEQYNILLQNVPPDLININNNIRAK